MKQEMLGIRCGQLSERHRLWGECYMADLDFIVTTIPAIEYNDRKAVALIEYKFGAGRIDQGSANLAATEDVANRAGLPFFVAQYTPDDWEFFVRPRNEQARAILPQRAWMSEREYVRFLYKLRGRVAPATLLAGLNSEYGEQAEEVEEAQEYQDGREQASDAGSGSATT